MNTYNIFDQNEPSCILFHAIAQSEEAVKDLAASNGINITGLKIELERSNVRDEMWRPYTPSITDAVVR